MESRLTYFDDELGLEENIKLANKIMSPFDNFKHKVIDIVKDSNVESGGDFI